MIPVFLTISLKSAAELLFISVIIVGMNIYEDRYKERIEEVQYSANIKINLLINPTHEYKGNNFCPVYCKVKHTHKAHINTYKCCKQYNCNHITYRVYEKKYLIYNF